MMTSNTTIQSQKNREQNSVWQHPRGMSEPES